MKIKPFVRPQEIPNPEPALEVFEHRQFELVLAAAYRSREIQESRLRELREEPSKRWLHQPTVAALNEFGSGVLDPQAYLLKAGQRRANIRPGRY